MTIPTISMRGSWKANCLFAAALAVSAAVPDTVRAQGLVRGAEQGARAGNRAAGPVGGVLGGAIGGVVGVFTGVLGVPANNGTSARAPAEGPPSTPKAGRATKAAKGRPSQTIPQPQAVELTAEQIVASSDANIERIKTELKLTPDQEKYWATFNAAMHDLGHHGADRLNLRIARAKRDPPDDIVEQMRNEAQFLVDRAADQRSVADASEPLFAGLDARQKAIFVEEMVRLSRERGLD
jgi:hypothetical protein